MIVLAVRLLLSFVFLLAGATKIVDPVGLRKAWRGFGLPAAFTGLALVLLPVVELAVGAALVPSGLAWYGASAALVLLTLFLLVVGVAMLRGRRPDCRCFGQVYSTPVGWTTLIRDCVLAAGAGWLVRRGPMHPGPDLWAWFATLNSQERKMSLLAACFGAFLFFRLVERARPSKAPVEAPELDEEVPPEAHTEPKRQSSARRPAPPEPSAPAKPGPMGIGLPIGTAAPDFELPAVTGQKHSLRSLREGGRDVLLVFSSPFCEPCNALTPKLAQWAGESCGVLQVVLVSRGRVEDNVPKLKGFEPSRVLLQRDAEVSEAYDCNVTPTGVLVGADGLIRSELAVGAAAIQQLIASCAIRSNQ